jgi:hypothetical protein
VQERITIALTDAGSDDQNRLTAIVNHAYSVNISLEIPSGTDTFADRSSGQL